MSKTVSNEKYKLDESWSLDQSTFRDFESFCRAYESDEEIQKNSNKQLSVKQLSKNKPTPKYDPDSSTGEFIIEESSENELSSQVSVKSVRKNNFLSQKHLINLSDENVDSEEFLHDKSDISEKRLESASEAKLPAIFSKQENSELFDFYKENFQDSENFDSSGDDFPKTGPNVMCSPMVSQKRVFHRRKKSLEKKNPIAIETDEEPEIIHLEDSTNSKEEINFKNRVLMPETKSCDKSSNNKPNSKPNKIVIDSYSSTDSEAEMQIIENEIRPGSMKRRSNSGNGDKREAKRMNSDEKRVILENSSFEKSSSENAIKKSTKRRTKRRPSSFTNFNCSQADFTDHSNDSNELDNSADLSVHKSDEEFLHDETQMVTNTQMVQLRNDLFEPSQHPIEFFNNKKKVVGYNREIDTSDEEEDGLNGGFNNYEENENTYLDDSFINNETMLTQNMSKIEVTPPPAMTQGPIKTRRQRKINSFKLDSFNRRLGLDTNSESRTNGESVKPKVKVKNKPGKRIVKFASSSDENE